MSGSTGFILLMQLLACWYHPSLCWDMCSELSEGREQLSDSRAAGELLLMSCLVLVVPVAANPLLPWQRQRRGPVRSLDTKKSRWRDQVSVW